VPSIPLTPAEERHALEVIGVQNIEDLFSTVPPKIRENADFKIDPGPGFDSTGRGLTEHELRNYMGQMAAQNAGGPGWSHFLGGGSYDNIIPAIVGQLVLRGEFLTSPTPQQPEISQGTLQAIFEFQTLIARLTGLPVANASMVDGSTATAEACLMAQRLSDPKRQTVLLAGSLHPDYRKVTETFLRGHSQLPLEVGWTSDGTLDLDALAGALKENPTCVLVVGYPNYFGVMEPLDKIRAALPSETLLTVAVSDPSSLSLFEAPGNLGADIVVGEAHQLGTPMLFGGPHVGFFASKKEFFRQMPGRFSCETVTKNNQRTYSLTLPSVESPIRSEKAASTRFSDTNQGLIALRTTIYLSFLGKRGFQRLGEINYSLFDYLVKELESNGIPLKFKAGLHYREGVFEVPKLSGRFEKAVAQKIIPGIRLCEKYPDREDFSGSLLICVHPKHTKNDLDTLVEVISNG